MRKALVAVTLALAALVAGVVDANPAAAQGTVQVGWVLDQHGSVACYRNSNHVWCNAYPAGNPNINANVIDDWLGVGPGGCPYTSVSLIAGGNGAPAQLWYPPACQPSTTGYVASGTLIPCYPNTSCWGYGSFSRPGSATWGYVDTEASGNYGTISYIFGV